MEKTLIFLDTVGDWVYIVFFLIVLFVLIASTFLRRKKGSKVNEPGCNHHDV